MSNVTEHQRPGVYSVYDASSAVSVNAGGGAAAIVGICSGGTAGQVYPLNSCEQAGAAFGAGADLAAWVELLFANGASKVYAVPVADAQGYAAAFAALEAVEDVAAVVCDSTTLAVQQALRDSVRSASSARRERLAVVPGATGETAAQLVERAASLNCERAILIAPGAVEYACAVAGAIAGETDPAVPLGGAELRSVVGFTTAWTDNEIDTMVLGGVTPLESLGGVVSIVRAVTTRTTTGGESDPTWRELTTIRVVDDVIPTLRRVLRARFSRAKNTAQGREAIRSQVIVELERKLADEIITGYSDVTVDPVENNPTVCLVEFKFTVAHGLNQIWLSAHITV